MSYKIGVLQTKTEYTKEQIVKWVTYYKDSEKYDGTLFSSKVDCLKRYLKNLNISHKEGKSLLLEVERDWE